MHDSYNSSKHKVMESNFYYSTEMHTDPTSPLFRLEVKAKTVVPSMHVWTFGLSVIIKKTNHLAEPWFSAKALEK